MIKRLFLLLLAGCAANNESLSTSDMAYENIWNLSQLSIGMCENEVLQIMHKPYKTQTVGCDDKKYKVWFYVTKATALGQERLVRANVTPLTFYNGVLQGWGFDYYNHILRHNQRSKDNLKEPPVKDQEDKRIEKAIKDLQKDSTTSQNDSLSTSNPDSEEASQEPPVEPSKERKKSSSESQNQGLDSDDENHLNDQNDAEFNFW